MWRGIRLRLVVPMIRSRQPPEYTARGVAVGLMWAFTPTFGVQMALTCIHWYVARTFFKKDFNVIMAMSWTWVTNLFTVAPAYYTFFLIGQIMLGRWHDLSGYQSFLTFWRTTMGDAGGDPASMEAWGTYFSVIVHGWGLAMAVGSVPIALVAYFIGYRWTLRAVRRWRSMRRRSAARTGGTGSAKPDGGAENPIGT